MNHNKKVLLIDADPQCNLSQYVLPEDEFITAYYSIDPPKKPTEPETIFSVVRPLSLGKGYNTSLPIRRADEFGVDVIIGDPRLALHEDLLAQDWREAKAGGIRGLRTTLVFHNVILQARKKITIIFFFDMGPSLGAINRAILLSVDYFVVPMAIDIFFKLGAKKILARQSSSGKKRFGIRLIQLGIPIGSP
ncbi:ParA family protein [Azotobacter vinelandii]